MRRCLLVLGLTLLAGCSGPEVAPPAIEPDVAPVVSASSAPDERAARALIDERRFAEASKAFEELSSFEVDPARRAEFWFLSGECALAAGDYHGAWRAYDKVLRRYPATPRYEQVVERTFLVGRLFCEELARRPTWFFGVEITDRTFGIEVLEGFQRARERHPLADDALHHVALARVASGEPELAIAAWQKLVDEYPASEWAETAQFEIARTFARMSAGVEYDKRPILTAVGRLRQYLERYPTGDHVVEAKAELARLEEELAGQQLDVAHFYLRRDRRYSAQLVLDLLVRDYPKTTAAGEALRLQRSLPRTSPPVAPPEPTEPPIDLKAPPPAPPDALVAPGD